MSEQQKTSEAPMAAPVANNVAIIGEPRVGGTVSGSYIYVNDAQNPEEDSVYRWYIDGVPGASTLGLTLTAEHLGKYLQFSVTPRAVSEELGLETWSNTLQVYDDFQGISPREMEGSFLSQDGSFSMYEREPTDRLLVSSAGALALQDGLAQNVFALGRNDFGANIPADIQRLLQNNPAVRLFSTGSDFGAVVSNAGTNQLLVWGPWMTTLPPEVGTRNIKSVYSNGSALAFIYNNPPPAANKIGALGNAANGGRVPDAVQRELLFDLPQAIYATETAFAVRTTDSYVHAWGLGLGGGTIDAETRQYLDQMRVTEIYATASAFCAIGPLRRGDPNELNIVAWGNKDGGGTLTAQQIETIMIGGGVRHVIAARNAFCVITKSGRVVVWGNAAHGGVLSAEAQQLNARGNIVMCVAAAWAFCMVNAFGQAAAWGTVGYGGNTPTDAEPVLLDAQRALENSGCKPGIEQLFEKWRVAERLLQLAPRTPHASPGCTCESVVRRSSSRLITVDGEVSLHSNDSSFFLLARDEFGLTEAVHVWGQTAAGGTLPQATRQVLEASLIDAVYCTNRSYGVLARQGVVQGAFIGWGATLAQGGAGEVPADLQALLQRDVVELYSIKRLPFAAPSVAIVNSAFIARKQAPGYVVWGAGGDLVNQYFEPGRESERLAQLSGQGS
ncbi:hypothetical protein M2D63_017095 [Pseudomonas sp. BJa5]|uniref:hypothetical protein n=1 Tax=Pseudomonas sp. BJa5 TaxID=2936270 RepID=UPI002559A2B6|nr:hypothetical protein [Pseudomonas sp. BGr12]MDL2422837.1 hypothetical protein [Pseudomonas sp. BGr12]